MPTYPTSDPAATYAPIPPLMNATTAPVLLGGNATSPVQPIMGSNTTASEFSGIINNTAASPASGSMMEDQSLYAAALEDYMMEYCKEQRIKNSLDECLSILTDVVFFGIPSIYEVCLEDATAAEVDSSSTLSSALFVHCVATQLPTMGGGSMSNATEAGDFFDMEVEGASEEKEETPTGEEDESLSIPPMLVAILVLVGMILLSGGCLLWALLLSKNGQRPCHNPQPHHHRAGSSSDKNIANVAVTGKTSTCGTKAIASASDAFTSIGTSSSINAIWYYYQQAQEDNHSSIGWQPLNLAEDLQVEELYQKYRSANSSNKAKACYYITSATTTSGSKDQRHSYSIDFASMTRTNTRSAVTQPMERRPKVAATTAENV